jgi:hypothetical protein
MIDEDYWRFALKTVQMTSSIAGDGGFLYQVPLPADCSRTRALYVVSQEKGSIGQRRPFDVRERGGAWQTNMPQFYAEYISSTLAMDSTQWPDHYMRALLRQIQYDQANLDETEHSESADRLKTSTDQQQAFAAWKDALAATTDSEAEPPDPWLPHQFSGAFARCLPTVMSKGYWKFALKRLQLNAETDQEAVAPIGDFPYSFALPADWFKTHAIYIPFDGAECPIDVREHEGHWNTATTAFMVRYISTAALDPTQWPDSVADAVEAYLEIDAAKNPAETKDAVDEWGRDLAAALVEWSLPEHPWLRFQLDGRYFETVKAVIGAARWRFATKTVNLTADATMNADGTVTGTPIPTALGDGSISPSYSAVFRKLPDWYRTLWMYRMVTSAPQVDVGYVYREDIDYRDEGGSWHTNWDTIQVRYLSRDGLDSTRWPASFRNAVLAWLRYEETQDPKALKFYEDAIARATEEDDTREKPPVNFRSRFTQARFGNRGYGNSGAGGAGGNTTTILTDENGNALTPG